MCFFFNQHFDNKDFSAIKYVHRCGRAGRNKVTNEAKGDYKETGDGANLKATVYSFFHRELGAMAKDVVELLRSCNSFVDTNLLSLIPTSKHGVEGEESAMSRSKRRKRNKKESETDIQSPKNDHEIEFDQEFASLQPNRIVLKRASHVSDAESDSDDF